MYLFNLFSFLFFSIICLFLLDAIPDFPVFKVAVLSIAFGAFLMAWDKHDLIQGYNGHALGFLLIFSGGLMFGGFFVNKLDIFKSFWNTGNVVYSIGFGLLSSIMFRIMFGSNCIYNLARFMVNRRFGKDKLGVRYAFLTGFLLSSALIVWAIVEFVSDISSYCIHLVSRLAVLAVGIVCISAMVNWARKQ